MLRCAGPNAFSKKEDTRHVFFTQRPYPRNCPSDQRSDWRGHLRNWALFPARIFAFLQDTQANLWEEMRGLHGAGLEPMLIAALVKELDIKGTLHVLRHGFKFYGKTFRLAYFKSAHGLNWEASELYGKNQLTVTRQTPCHPSDKSTVDCSQ